MANVIPRILLLLAVVPQVFLPEFMRHARFSIAVILEKEAVGGQTILTTEIDNYPGMPHTDGFTIADTMQKASRRSWCPGGNGQRGGSQA